MAGGKLGNVLCGGVENALHRLPGVKRAVGRDDHVAQPQQHVVGKQGIQVVLLADVSASQGSTSKMATFIKMSAGSPLDSALP